MKNKFIYTISFLIALSIKLLVFYLMFSFAIEYYDPTLSFLKQHFIVWVFLYLIYFAGLESVVALFFKNKKSSEELKSKEENK